MPSLSANAALAQDVTTDAILTRVLAAVPAPRVHIGDPYEPAKAAPAAPTA